MYQMFCKIIREQSNIIKEQKLEIKKYKIKIIKLQNLLYNKNEN